MPGVKVILVHGPIGMFRHGSRVTLDRTPKVRYKPVFIVDCLRTTPPIGPAK
jgi:hypothetical protein